MLRLWVGLRPPTLAGSRNTYYSEKNAKNVLGVQCRRTQASSSPVEEMAQAAVMQTAVRLPATYDDGNDD